MSPVNIFLCAVLSLYLTIAPVIVLLSVHLAGALYVGITVQRCILHAGCVYTVYTRSGITQDCDPHRKNARTPAYTFHTGSPHIPTSGPLHRDRQSGTSYRSKRSTSAGTLHRGRRFKLAAASYRSRRFNLVEIPLQRQAFPTRAGSQLWPEPSTGPGATSWPKCSTGVGATFWPEPLSGEAAPPWPEPGTPLWP